MWMAIAGAAMQMVSGIMGGVSKFQAERAQATLLKRQGQSQLQAGAAAGQRQQEIESAKLGELRATIGASGVQMQGSPMEVYFDSVKNAALNVQDKIYQGKAAAWESKIAAEAHRRAGTSELVLGILGSTGSAMQSMGTTYMAGKGGGLGSTLLGGGSGGGTT